MLHGDIAGPLGRMTAPVRFLDFETFAPAIPRFPGTPPFDPIPFLFSVHIERAGEPLAYTGYLHESDDDPRPVIAGRVI